ncbi:MAG: gfo/Idh/MocA family oxidoreductase, partial [Litoreibacter sp.]
LTRGGAGANDAAAAVSRIPGGHPEGYLEGFATIYNDAANAIRAVQSGASRDEAMGVLPGIAAGRAGMAFINACVTSSAADGAWKKV